MESSRNDNRQSPLTRLPAWHRPLAVVAHPDDESFGLGAILSAWVDAGAEPAVLCLTRGEASTLHGVEGELATLRAAELAEAARRLGLKQVTLLDHPDGGLPHVDHAALLGDVLAAAVRYQADGLLAFDRGGITGHPDHDMATAIAVEAGVQLGLQTLAWALSREVAGTLRDESGAGFIGREEHELDFAVQVDRSRQLDAVAAHPSQAVPGSVLFRRLELSGATEFLRWL